MYRKNNNQPHKKKLLKKLTEKEKVGVNVLLNFVICPFRPCVCHAWWWVLYDLNSNIIKENPVISGYYWSILTII